MLKKLKDLRVILIFVLIVSWAVIGVFFYTFKTNTDAELASKDSTIESLNASLAEIGELVPAYTVGADVPSGKQIEESDLVPIEVPLSMSTNLVQDPAEIVGKFFKLGLTAGSVITTDCIYEEVITDDLRYLDVITHMNPVGLEEGSYVDIRIQMPLGEDYVAIPHRRVIEINSGILKVAVTEEDIHIYNSLLVDTILYPGSQIYAIEYIEGGLQNAAESYYPMSTSILAIAQKDPNLLKAIKTDILAKRNLLDTAMAGAGVGLSERELEGLNSLIESSRNSIIDAMESSQQEVEKEREEFERQQAELAAQ